MKRPSEMESFPKGKPDWANLSILHRNTLAPRSRFQLYNSEKDALDRDEAKSRALCLSGEWKFHLANSPLEAVEGFEATSFDSSKWSSISVPGMWQLQNYGKGPHYTNVQYPFFVNPPDPPYRDNETGSYLTTFTVPSELENDQLRLRFEGVDSSFHVWINGKEVGYSQGSRNPSEFDVTDLIIKGQSNVLAVRVYQFCDGSYIEDQDQWWLSGIFRDVFLLGFPKKARFEDLMVNTFLDEKYHDATLAVHVELSGHATIGLKLLNAEEKEIVKISTKVAPGSHRKTYDFSFVISNPHKWTAETPYLYHLVLSLDDELFTGHRVGFRQVEVKDGLIKVNGQRVVFKGANRHEHHPLHGRAVPYDFMKHDLLLMKTHNINAIRTCHQPSDPRMYDLADELGFWVMDEADLECHGFAYMSDAHKWTSDNPDWHDAYVDRARQLVQRDKLHPCVVLWSLGNEAFYGQNHTAMVKWIKSVDPTRPIHYEQDYGADHVDIYSRMYSSPDDIINFAHTKSQAKPIVLCEYIHAMGTGPGNIKEYIDAFYEHAPLQGGWVWEWANHGLLTKTADGEEFYGYGGDFGDEPNDSNFVMDGVLNSDHTPNSGLIEYKKAIEPVQVVTSTAKTVTIINRRDFATLDDLQCTWHLVSEDSKLSEKGEIELPNGIKPGALAELELPHVKNKGHGECLLELQFRLKERAEWAPKGFELAWGQIQLHPTPSITRATIEDKKDVAIEKLGSKLIIRSKQSKWEVDLSLGALSSWKKQGKEVIAQALEPSFYRAPTDNDAPQDGWDWNDRRLQYGTVQTRQSKWYGKNGKIIVELHQKFGPAVLSWYLDLQTRYTFEPDGTLTYHCKGIPVGENLPKTLPRIGITLGLPDDFQNIQWFGRGPGESYKDMKLSQKVGLHSVTKVDDLWAAPDFPQDCSNRTDTRWLKLSSKHSSLTAQFLQPHKHEKRHLFDFMACHYDVKDIAAARHPYELEKKRKDHVVLRLDADHHGLGTASCGPKTLEKYSLKTEPFEFGILFH